MKVFFLLVTLLALGMTIFGQDPLVKDLDRSFKRFDLIKLAPSTVEAKVEAGQTMKLRARGQTFEFDLYEHDLRAPNYRAIETNNNGSYELPRDEVKTYRGKLRGDYTSEVRFTVGERTLEGLIYGSDTKLFIARAGRFSPHAEHDDAVVYAEGDLAKAVDLTGDIVAKAESESESYRPPIGTEFATFSDVRQLEVATEADYAWVSQSGGGSSAANTEILAILNLVDGIYKRDLNLTIVVTYQHAWTSPDPFSGSSMSALLDTYLSYWNTNFPVSQFPRDTSHLFTGKFSGQGLAYVGVICRSPNLAYGITARSGGANHLIAAHEIGHNLGADHVANSGSCANSMMNPSLNGSVTAFCDTSIGVISSFVSQYGSCLTITGPAPTPTPAPVPSPTPTPWPSPTPVPSPTPTPWPTPFPSPTATPFPSPSPTPGSRANYALASSGGTVTSSSGWGISPIDGSLVWAVGGAWKDTDPFVFPDWMQVDFNGSRTIDEINVISVMDDYLSVVPPTLSTTASIYGITSFNVQYWNGTSWITVPNGNVVGTNKVWTRLTFSPITTSKIRVVVNASQDGYSRIVELEAWGGGTATPSPSPTVNPSPTPTVNPSPTPTVNPSPTPTPVPSPTPGTRVNAALSSNGGTASASSILGAPSAAIDGVRSWAISGSWKDLTPFIYPDWMQVDFNGTKTIDEIDIYGVRDDYLNTAEPTTSTVSTIYGIVNFDVQYWNGSSWVNVPGGSITGNNLVLRKLTFSPITTSRIRVVINSAQDGYSRIVELEAWTSTGGGAPAPTPTPTPTVTPTPTPTPSASPSPTPTVRTNYARSINGGSATASSELNSASAAIDGSLVWAIGGAWKDSLPFVYPDWLQVNLNGAKTIDEINVYAVMDDYLSTVPPTTGTTASIYGLTSFEVQYWNGSTWATVPNGNVTGNNKVLRKFTFSPITTTAIRVVVTGAHDGFSRIVELEAWGGGGGAFGSILNQPEESPSAIFGDQVRATAPRFFQIARSIIGFSS